MTSLQRGASVVQDKKEGWPPLLLVIHKGHELVTTLSGPSAQCQRDHVHDGRFHTAPHCQLCLVLQLPTLRQPAPMAGGTVKFEIFTQAEAVDVLDAAVHHIQQAVRLFGMAAAQGVSESQMVEVLRRQVFPSLKTEELQHLAKIFSHVRDSEVGGKAEGKRPLEPTTEDGDAATQQTNKAQKTTESTITTQQCMFESHNLVDPSQQVPELGATDPQTGICKAVQSLPGAQTAQDLSRQPMLAVAVAAAAEPANVSQMPDASANKYAASLTPEKEHSNGVLKAEIPNSHRGSPLPGLLPGLGAGPRATRPLLTPLTNI